MDLSFLPEHQRPLAQDIINQCAMSRVWFVQNVLKVEHIETWQMEELEALDAGVTKTSIRSGHGVGKALALDTVVPTPSGPRVWGTLQPGDWLFGKDGNPTKILARHDHDDKAMYRIKFDDGIETVTCEDHQWLVKGRKERRNKLGWKTTTTKKMLANGVVRKNGNAVTKNWCLPPNRAVNLPARDDLYVHPYVLGLWLGDGALGCGRITGDRNEATWDDVRHIYPLGRPYFDSRSSAVTYTVLGLKEKLSVEGILNYKHVPEKYLYGDIEQRTELLRGMMDSDGWQENGGTRAGFCSKDKVLCENVLYLARSLGMKAWMCRERENSYVARMVGELCPFALKRKAIGWRACEERYLLRWVTDIEFVGYANCMCVTVDADDSLFLCNDFVVTHNTAFCSWLALHFLLFRNDVKVIVTSPSLKQLTDGLIPELQKWISRLPRWLSMQLDITSERCTRKPDNKNNFISFRTARKENPEALAGVHAESVLIIVDEASGVDEVVYETGQGALSTIGSIAVLIGNPTKPSGFFFKTHNELSDLWRTRKVACMESSRVSEDYIKSQERTYGRDSREFKVRVLGEFPESGENAVVPRAYVESAQGRDIVSPSGGVVWGLDPGRGGDPSGFISRNAKEILELDEFRLDDSMKLVGVVKHRWDTTPSRYRPTEIFVDAIGLGGPIADRLSELGLPVTHVNVSEVAAMSDRYVRLRDELWYECRHWFEAMDVTMPTKRQSPLIEKLTHELASVESEIMSSGKLQVESKEKMKKRGNKSPNMADALCLTFAGGGAVQAGAKDAVWGKFDLSKYKAPNVF